MTAGTVTTERTTINVLNAFYGFATEGDYTGAYSFEDVFEDNKIEGEASGYSLQFRAVIDFSEFVLFDNSFTDEYYQVVIKAKRTEDPALPNGDTIVSIEYPIMLETATDYGLKLSATSGTSDLIVRDSSDSVSFKTTYEGVPSDSELSMRYTLYQETGYEIIDGILYSNTYEAVNWGDLAITLASDGTTFTTDGSHATCALEPAASLDVTLSGTLTDLPNGNYKIVCDMIVGGYYVAQDFIIFGVNDSLTPQLEIPDAVE